jgi:hypothetical protein
MYCCDGVAAIVERSRRALLFGVRGAVYRGVGVTFDGRSLGTLGPRLRGGDG